MHAVNLPSGEPPSLPDIPIRYPSRFPVDYELRPRHYLPPEHIVLRPRITAAVDGVNTEINPISVLDVEFLDSRLIKSAQAGLVNLKKYFPCGNACRHCFEEGETAYRDPFKLLPWEAMLEHMVDAQRIGLYAANFIGPGDFFQNPEALKILDAIYTHLSPLKFGIFTRGAELGRDRLAEAIFRDTENITRSKELVARLAEYPDLSIYMHFGSLYASRQDFLCGSTGLTQDYRYDTTTGIISDRGVSEYTTARNRAIENLAEHDFFEPITDGLGQRVTFVATPYPLWWSEDAADLFEYAARVGACPCIAPSMEKGKGQELVRVLTGKKGYLETVQEVYLNVNERGLEIGAIQPRVLSEDGVSAYAGIAPCNRVQGTGGLMLRATGDIIACPSAEEVLGNVHQSPLAGIWARNQLPVTLNNRCRHKPKSLPDTVLEHVETELHRRRGINFFGIENI
jgi:hypothetical protein